VPGNGNPSIYLYSSLFALCNVQLILVLNMDVHQMRNLMCVYGICELKINLEKEKREYLVMNSGQWQSSWSWGARCMYCHRFRNSNKNPVRIKSGAHIKHLKQNQQAWGAMGVLNYVLWNGIWQNEWRWLFSRLH